MDMLTLSVDLKALETNYETDFLSAKSNNTLEVMNKYCNTYPKSAHAAELKPLIMAQQQKAMQQEKNEHVSEVRSKYMHLYKKN
jgi:hypothetical protein